MMFVRIVTIAFCIFAMFTAALLGLLWALGEQSAVTLMQAVGSFVLFGFLPLEATKALLGPVMWRSK